MTIKGKKIGFALTGSHCTYEDIWPQIKKLRESGAEIYPIASQTVAETTTRLELAARS